MSPEVVVLGSIKFEGLFNNLKRPALFHCSTDLSVIGSAAPEDKGNQHAEHNRWFKEGISSPGSQITSSSAGLVTSLYYVLFQSANQSTAVVNFLVALVNR